MKLWCSVASNSSCVHDSRHALEHYTCALPCFHEVPTHGHFGCLSVTMFNFKTMLNYISLKQLIIIMQIVLNICSIGVISNWSSGCIFVTLVHCLYSTGQLVAHGGA